MQQVFKLLRFLYSYPGRLFNKVSFLAIIVDSKIAKNVAIQSFSDIRYSKINQFTYIGKKTNIAYTNIGKFCSIASNVTIGGGSHPFDWVSTSPVFYSGRNIFKSNFSNTDYNPFKTTTIGNDVWIGSNTIVKSGVQVGDGAIIGMGSVVTKDVEPYAIVAGNPARFIRSRFANKTVNELLQKKWWDYDINILKNNGLLFKSVSDFLEEFK